MSSGVVGTQGLLSAADSKAGSGGSGGSAGPGTIGDGEGGPEEKARYINGEGPTKKIHREGTHDGGVWLVSVS